MQGNGLNKFRTIVSEVSSFVGNPDGKSTCRIDCTVQKGNFILHVEETEKEIERSPNMFVRLEE